MNEREIEIRSLERQLDVRLDKLWKVFSWTSTIFITIIAGLVAITRNKDLVALKDEERMIISSVVIILMIYAFLWLRENLNTEGKLREMLIDRFEESSGKGNVYSLRPDKTYFGYKLVIILLGLIALIATWYPN